MNFIRIGSVLIVVAGLLCAVAGIADAQTLPGVVIDYYPPAGSVYIASPSIVILSNGDYIASHDQYPGTIATHLFRSQDRGITWSWLTELPGQYESTLFVHNGVLYLFGGFNDGADEYATIRKSTDGGLTWSDAVSSTTGWLTPAAGYNAAPVPVLVHDDRIWRAIEMVDPCVPPALSQEFRAMVLSAPVNADLLDASNWTISNSLLMLDYMANMGWLEGNVVVTPSGDIQNILRVAGMTDKAAVIQLSSDGQTLTYDPETIIDFPGGSSKFTIRYDPQSDRYWSLVNEYLNPPAVRNRLKLSSSADLVNWTVEAAVLEHPNSVEVGFQYADWQFDGEDIIAVCRTAFGGSGSFHDGEFVTFHRIPNFRLLSQATTSLIDASEDAEIDGHVNWRSSPKGVPNAGWGHTATELKIQIYDPVAYPGADASHTLVKWDLSSISGTDVVTAVTLEMSGWDYSDGAIDVYAIEVGDWAEATVSWNSWAATDKTLVFLGQLTCAGPANTAGQTAFSNPELMAWVLDWISGVQNNYGLILKMHDDGSPGGDSFSSHEDTWISGHAPRLIIQHIPESAFATLEGTVDPLGYAGDLQNVGVQVELRQNSVVARTEKMLLDSAGDFSIDLVPQGTYDVAVKTLAYLQKVMVDVDVSIDPTDVGTIELAGGDFNGDSFINLSDFAIMASNWLSIEEP